MFSILKTLHLKGVAKFGFEDPEPFDDLALPTEYQKLYQLIQQRTAEIFELPLFRIDVSYDEQLHWSPGQLAIIDRIDAVRADFIDILFKVPRLVVNPLFKQYVACDLEFDRAGGEKFSTPDLGQIIFSDALYKEVMKKQSLIIGHGFSLLEFCSTEFKRGIDIFEQNNNFDIEFLDDPDVTATQVRMKMAELREQEDFLRTLVEKSDVGLFNIITKEMKQLFMKSPGRCLSLIRQQIPTVIQRFLTDFGNNVSKAFAELTAATVDVRTFVDYIYAVASHSAAMPILQIRAEVIRGFQALASEQAIPVATEDLMNFQELLPVFDEVKRCLTSSTEIGRAHV
jgi:dynein heavy chain